MTTPLTETAPACDSGAVMMASQYTRSGARSISEFLLTYRQLPCDDLAARLAQAYRVLGVVWEEVAIEPEK